jgi:hypothetical protein
MGTMGYATISGAKMQAIRPARRNKRKEMKLSLKQRIKNWLNNDEYEQDIPQLVESERFGSEGMHMKIFKASGGYVVETRSYDSHKDRNFTNMHVITDEQDLGDTLGKIVMMEALKR